MASSRTENLRRRGRTYGGHKDGHDEIGSKVQNADGKHRTSPFEAMAEPMRPGMVSEMRKDVITGRCWVYLNDVRFWLPPQPAVAV
jgi:hypothetical protein